jgi:NAD(P)H dehydrogenase (quinone)
MASSESLLVTGASGHLGRLVVRHLLDTLQVPAARIIATSRKPGELAEFSARGVTVRAADFDHASALQEAFRGAGRLLLISTDRLDAPGVRLAQHRTAIEAAVKAGVQHIVYTSMPKAERSLVAFAPDHAGTEAALAASPLAGWTVLRNHWYFENLFHKIPGVLASGKWYSGAEGGKVADIARDDLARAAAVALASASQEKATYTLSGAQALSIPQIAALISRALGKPIEVVPTTIDGLVAGMAAHGFPEPVARIFASFDTNTAAGGFAEVTGDYRKLTGLQPQSFEDWLEHNKAGLAGKAA